MSPPEEFLSDEGLSANHHQRQWNLPAPRSYPESSGGFLRAFCAKTKGERNKEYLFHFWNDPSSTLPYKQALWNAMLWPSEGSEDSMGPGRENREKRFSQTGRAKFISLIDYTPKSAPSLKAKAQEETFY